MMDQISEGYEKLWKAFILPNRYEYDLDSLGPKVANGVMLGHSDRKGHVFPRGLSGGVRWWPTRHVALLPFRIQCSFFLLSVRAPPICR